MVYCGLISCVLSGVRIWLTLIIVSKNIFGLLYVVCVKGGINVYR